MRKILARRELIPALLVVVVFFIAARQSPYFLDARYLLDKTTEYTEVGLVALAMTFVIVTGSIDLSVASMVALVACLSAIMLGAGWPVWLVVVLGLLLGVGLGTINGAIIAYLRLPSFVVTLATMAAYRGIAHALLGAESIKVPVKLTGIDLVHLPGTPIPVSLAILIAAAIVVALVLHQTVFGRWVFSVGTNERAALYSGVPTERVKVWVFALAGLMSALAAFHIDSRLGVARFDHAQGLELDAITAVVLGGTSILGGQGSIGGTMIALLLVALIRTGMGVANVTAEYQLAVIGTLLVLTVIVANLVEKLSSRAKIVHTQV